MKKINSILVVLFLLIPFVSHSQIDALSYEQNVKVKKKLEERKLKKHNVILQLGLQGMSSAYGANGTIGIEYMITDKLGLDLSGTIIGNSAYGIRGVALDMKYHFIQNRHWDIYGFFGLSKMFYTNSIRDWGAGRKDFPSLDAGLGVRYKVSKRVGLQLEGGARFGRAYSSFGATFKFGKK